MLALQWGYRVLKQVCFDDSKEKRRTLFFMHLKLKFF